MRSKSLGLGLTFLAAAAIWVFAGSSTTQAFHSGGVAECNGCHSMHSPKAGGSHLLLAVDPSSTCLTCHENAADTGPSSYHVSTTSSKLGAGMSPLQRTPGGDFGYLKKGYSFAGRGGSTVVELAETHGHNVVAADYAYIADPLNTLAPGGTFSGAQLGCTSCHDPHGRLRRRSDGSYATGAALGGVGDPIIASGSYANSPDPTTGQAVGVYRLLRGLGDNSVGATFAGVAIAVAPATYNRTEAATDTRVAYGSAGTDTWGNWCASCHPSMHSSGNYVHKIDWAMGGGNTHNVYNAYVKSGDLSGTSGTSFTSLVPFAEKTGSISVLKSHAVNNGSYANGPSSTDEVTCLSCHRAHASGFKHALRWNMEYEFMTQNSLYTSTTNNYLGQGRTEAEMTAAYYDRPPTKFASYQRVLCNKCHAKD